MRRQHFEILQPICPVCKDALAGTSSRLTISMANKEEDDQIVEGVLLCSNEHCLSEFPIIDGVPILLPRLRAFIAENLLAIYGRADLSATQESILGDCCSQDSHFDSIRRQLSSYAWDHYASLDPEEEKNDQLSSQPGPGSIVRLLDNGIRLTDGDWHGPILDVGCSVGRTTFELAARTGQLVLGIDVNFSSLRLAAGVLRGKPITYPRRRIGLVYDRRSFLYPFPASKNVDFWLCDATHLPFPDGSFPSAIAMNVLDSIPAPAELVRSLGRVLGAQGRILLSCPFDWSVSVTPVEAWIGGHSQRGRDRGAGAAALRRLLAATEAGDTSRFELLAESDDHEWAIRIHERSSMTYNVHLVCAERRPLS